MAESTIMVKGQTTVPADIRAFVDAKPGTRLVWSAMPDGTIIVRPRPSPSLTWPGCSRHRKPRMANTSASAI